MRMPRRPPAGSVWEAEDRVPLLLDAVNSHLVEGRYLHWDKVRYHTPPEGLTAVEWWHAIKFRRSLQYKELPLTDRFGTSFKYLMGDPMPEMIHQIDLGAGGHIGMPEHVTNAEARDQYYVSSLIDEAITSSQLEGATTTRPIAKEMIRTGRPPRDRSERMILNNYRAMKRIGSLASSALSKELVFELHRIVTDRALDDQSAVGRFRRSAESVRVEGPEGEVFHEPPPADELERRMEAMCGFANGQTPEEFLYPVVRSIILHFWLSYDHPFVDGNGRTARALFYWSMLHHKYWLCEFVSISQIIRKAPVKYGRAFLHTETDGNDVTYFILYHLDVILKAIRELHAYIERKARDLRRLEAGLRGIEVLNHRQRALVSHAIRHPNTRFTIHSHQTSHAVAYETARTDLMDLTAKGLLKSAKVGRQWTFVAVSHLEDELTKLSVF